MATTVQATVTITQVTVILTCRCYGARFDGRCDHVAPLGPSGMPSCPPDCECHDCWMALRYEREAQVWSDFHAQTMLPPAPESAVEMPECPAPYVGEDIAQTAVETVRPGRAA